MASGVDMSDKNAWDDSFLQDSWNDAVAEYEVSLTYPSRASLAKSGLEVPQHRQVTQAPRGCLDCGRAEGAARVSVFPESNEAALTVVGTMAT